MQPLRRKITGAVLVVARRRGKGERRNPTRAQDLYGQPCPALALCVVATLVSELHSGRSFRNNIPCEELKRARPATQCCRGAERNTSGDVLTLTVRGLNVIVRTIIFLSYIRFTTDLRPITQDYFDENSLRWKAVGRTEGRRIVLLFWFASYVILRQKLRASHRAPSGSSGPDAELWRTPAG